MCQMLFYSFESYLLNSWLVSQNLWASVSLRKVGEESLRHPRYISVSNHKRAEERSSHSCRREDNTTTPVHCLKLSRRQTHLSYPSVYIKYHNVYMDREDVG